VFWYALFVLGYVLASIGAGVILFHSVTTIMSTSHASTHRNTDEDEIWATLLVTVGIAALWPVTFPLYLASRAAANAVS
jgi:arylamine N-acetyltransferase